MMLDSIRHRGTVVSMILPKERILAGMPVKKRCSLQSSFLRKQESRPNYPCRNQDSCFRRNDVDYLYSSIKLIP